MMVSHVGWRCCYQQRISRHETTVLTPIQEPS
nr:MAG TPA: hypothetical protein [Caudoviricetes sp.]